MEVLKGWKRVKPLSAVLITLILALSLPPLDVRRIRGAAAWFATPLWSAVNQLREEMTPEAALRERVRQLELEKALLIRRIEESGTEAAPSVQGLRVKVLAREPGAWERFLWIDAGRETAGEQGPLQKYSPVVAGDAVVGMVEYVGRRQSLVRLLSDAQCCPAVEVCEKGPSGILVAARRLDILLRNAEGVEPSLKHMLHQNLAQLQIGQPTTMPLKGILKGAVQLPGIGIRLKGDFFSNELDTVSGNVQSASLPQSGQLLMTTGLDGLFPAGLKVALLESIQQERAGQMLRSFTAIPAVESLDDLQWLTVLYPRGFSDTDRPRPSWEEHIANHS